VNLSVQLDLLTANPHLYRAGTVPPRQSGATARLREDPLLSPNQAEALANPTAPRPMPPA
jgi:hypothetical protein